MLTPRDYNSSRIPHTSADCTAAAAADSVDSAAGNDPATVAAAAADSTEADHSTSAAAEAVDVALAAAAAELAAPNSYIAAVAADTADHTAEHKLALPLAELGPTEPGHDGVSVQSQLEPCALRLLHGCSFSPAPELQWHRSSQRKDQVFCFSPAD